ncbi:unnamed protein product [Paramecium sonneborni]|uniref:Uncharacterized protein n=1 Tax=Paramecium sonneborni TaxID=65129 RepID=A0A8S1RGW6_9CILI|nr:unnamed protein product [Paramecium sonneborni]
MLRIYLQLQIILSKVYLPKERIIYKEILQLILKKIDHQVKNQIILLLIKLLKLEMYPSKELYLQVEKRKLLILALKKILIQNNLIKPQ